MSRFVLVINPTSGKGAGARLGSDFRARLVGLGHEVIDCSAPTPHEAVDLARREIEAGVDGVLVAGGDGTVNLGVNLVAGTTLPLGVMACGTGNDVATNLGLPVRDPARAAQIVHERHTRAVDAMRVVTEAGPRAGETAHFIGALGAGFDAIVTARASRMRWPRGQMRYNLAVLRELPVFRPIPFVLTIDGQERRVEGMLVAAANATSFGGGMRICPEAEMDDGLIDLLILSKVSLLDFLKVFPSVYKGAHVDHPAVEIIRAHRVRIDAPGVTSQADGELFLPLPVTIDVLPRAVHVLVPTGATGRTSPTPTEGERA